MAVRVEIALTRLPSADPGWDRNEKGRRHTDPFVVILSRIVQRLPAAPLEPVPVPVPMLPLEVLPAAPGAAGAMPVPVVAPVADPVERSMLFSELLFTLPGLFMLPSALPPPAAVCDRAAPERATVSAAASAKVLDLMAVSIPVCR